SHRGHQRRSYSRNGIDLFATLASDQKQDQEQGANHYTKEFNLGYRAGDDQAGELVRRQRRKCARRYRKTEEDDRAQPYRQTENLEKMQNDVRRLWAGVETAPLTLSSLDHDSHSGHLPLTMRGHRGGCRFPAYASSG